MIDLLLEIKERVEQLEPAEDLSSEELAAYKKHYAEIIDAGYQGNPPPANTNKRGRPKQGRARNMLNRLNEHSHEVLAFMEGSPAIFDNNQALSRGIFNPQDLQKALFQRVSCLNPEDYVFT